MERILEIKDEIARRNTEHFNADRNFQAVLSGKEIPFIEQCIFNMYSKTNSLPFDKDTMKDIRVEVNGRGHSLPSFDPRMTHFVVYYMSPLSDTVPMSFEIGYRKLAGPADLSGEGIKKKIAQDHRSRVNQLLRSEVKWHPEYPSIEDEKCHECGGLAEEVHHHLYSMSELIEDYNKEVEKRRQIKYPAAEDISNKNGENNELSEYASEEAKAYVKNFLRVHYKYIEKGEMELILLCKECHKRYPKKFSLDEPIIIKPKELPAEDIDISDLLSCLKNFS